MKSEWKQNTYLLLHRYRTRYFILQRREEAKVTNEILINVCNTQYVFTL